MFPVSFAESAIKRLIDLHEYPGGRLIMLFVYTWIAIVFGFVFHHTAEKPFIHYSKRLYSTAREKASVQEKRIVIGGS